MTPILQREDGGDGGAEGGGGWNESRASKAEEGRGGEGGREGSSGAKQQGPRQKQKGKRKQIFFLLAAGKEAFMFLYNEQNSHSKRRGQEKLGFSK